MSKVMSIKIEHQTGNMVVSLVIVALLPQSTGDVGWGFTLYARRDVLPHVVFSRQYIGNMVVPYFVTRRRCGV